jgi:non-ribosomal peptide synthase protein (TIGR01720 family)
VVAPRTPAEELLAGIWAQVLGVDRVGVEDDFFTLGGDSILAIQATARARQAGLHFTPRDLFEHPTVRGLAAAARTEAPDRPAEPAASDGEVPLTPIERSFLTSDLAAPSHHNQWLLLRLDWPVDPARLQAALAAVVGRHEALRLRLRLDGNGWRQTVAAREDGPVFTHVELRHLQPETHQVAMESAAARLQATLDLAAGPLLKAALFDLGSGRPQRLLLLAHHAAVDAVSWRILLEDLQAAYTQLGSAPAAQLPAVPTSFRGWAERLAGYARSAALGDATAFWRTQTAAPQPPPLPVDHAGGANTVAAERCVTMQLDLDETAALRRAAPAGFRVDDLLLTALALACSRWTGQSRVLVDVEVHGRDDPFGHADLSRTVGWLTAIFPVLLDLDGTADPAACLEAVRARLRAAAAHALGYGLLRHLGGDAETARALAAAPAAQLSFNYLGQVDVADGSREWQPEAGGLSRDPSASRGHLLRLESLTSGGRLEVNWFYSLGLHEETTVRELAEQHLTALRTLLVLGGTGA